VLLAARMFRERAKRSPGAWLKYRGENSMEADVLLADPGGIKIAMRSSLPSATPWRWWMRRRWWDAGSQPHCLDPQREVLPDQASLLQLRQRPEQDLRYFAID